MLPAWPEQWRWPRQRTGWLFVASVIGIAGLGALFTGNWGTTLVCVVAFAIAIMVWQDSRVSHAVPEFINAVALTDASVAPVDSWVHFFRAKRDGLLVVLVFAAISIALVALSVAAWVVVPVRDVDPVLIRVVGAAVGAVGVFCLVAAVASFVVRGRVSSFGKAPVGYAVGRGGLMIVTLQAPRYVPWTAIADVVPEQRNSREVDSLRKERGTMWLTIVEASGERTRLLAESAVHPWVFYGAVVQAWRDAGFRAQLGTSAAQKQLETWVSEVSAKRKP